MKYLFVLSFLIFTSGQLLAEELTTRDFAWGYYLEVDKKGAVYSLELPEDVYRTVRSADLRDVAVFNGAGEVVPHAYRDVAANSPVVRESEIMPFFPLFQAEISGNNAGFSLQVSRDSNGAILNIQPDVAASAEDQKLTGYLIDISDAKKAVSELEFHWKKDIDSSVFTVDIEQSDDLVHWIPLVYSATLADLQFAGQKVERRNIQLPGQPLKYLKLSWQQSHWPLRLTEITSIFKIIEENRKYRWVSLYNGANNDNDEQLLVDFETHYRIPASSAEIRFPETNSIARLSILSRPGVDAAWRIRCEQVFFDLSFEGTAINNDPCDFFPTADSLWRVMVKEDGAGLGSEKKAITLQLGWQPSELLFIGRGMPPYLLAFGSGKLALQERKSVNGMLLQTIEKEATTQVIHQARLGRKISLGGEFALQNPTNPPPWKKWFLWGVLVLGVGILAFMVRSLMKEIKKAEEKKLSEER